MARVFIPFVLRKLTDGVTEVRVSGGTLREVIDNLEEMYPGTKERIVVNDAIKSGLAAVVGEQPTREGLRTKVGEDTEVHFIPHIAGGRAGVPAPFVRLRTTPSRDWGVYGRFGGGCPRGDWDYS